jgi:hypothetical protein
MVRDFLNVIMKNNFFNCIGKTWKMSEFGTAQGTPCSPPYANIYLANLEKELYGTCAHIYGHSSSKDSWMMVLLYSNNRNSNGMEMHMTHSDLR